MEQRVIPHLFRGDFTGLCNEFLHGHIQIIEAEEVHLGFVKLILKVETLLDEFQLYQSWHDLARGQLLGSDHLDKFLSALMYIINTISKDVLVGK